jgi:hypothetical protein
MESPDCAVGSDGKLLDASQITWYNDPDDDEPMAPTTAATTTAVQRNLSATTLDSFLSKAPAAENMAESRRSTRAIRPSMKVVDPDNAMALKRKPSRSTTAKPARRLRQVSPSPDLTDSNDEPVPTDNEEDNIPTEPDDAYEQTKALGDADREVCIHTLPQTPCLMLSQRPYTRKPRRNAPPTSARSS